MIKYLFAVFLLFASPAWAGDQVLFGGLDDDLPTSATEHTGIWTSDGFSNMFWGNNVRKSFITAPGTIKDLRVSLDGAPGSGNSYKFTIFVEGIATALTTTISNTDTSNSDTVHTVAVTAGETWLIEVVPTSTPTTTNARWSVIFSSTNTGETLLLGGTGSRTSSSTSSLYHSLAGISETETAEGKARVVIPAPGTLKNLYAGVTVAPGSGDSWIFTVRINGSSSTITTTISGVSETEDNDSVNTESVSAGDTITILRTGTGTPASTAFILGLTFDADTDGNFIIPVSDGVDMNKTATEFTYLTSAQSGWMTTETNVTSLGQACTIKKIYVVLEADPTQGGSSYAFTLRQDTGSGAGDSSLGCTVSAGSAVCNATTDVSVSNDDLLGTKKIPAGNPFFRYASISYLGNVTIAAVGRRIMVISKWEETCDSLLRSWRSLVSHSLFGLLKFA